MPEIFLPVKDFDLSSKVDDLNKNLASLKDNTLHVKGKVDMLNDWHNEVNLKFERIGGRFDRQDERLAWILRLVIVAGVLSELDRIQLTNLLPVLNLISKLFGG